MQTVFDKTGRVIDELIVLVYYIFAVVLCAFLSNWDWPANEGGNRQEQSKAAVEHGCRKGMYRYMGKDPMNNPPQMVEWAKRVMTQKNFQSCCRKR